MIKQKLYNESEVSLISDQPLSVLQLSLIADEICEDISIYRPEFYNLAHLQRCVGCRVQELFQPNRWELISNTTLKVQPQKGNATRILQLSDISFTDAASFAATLADMGRLPKRQYDRAFSAIVKEKALWRLFDEGFAHPSTHFFRHVKIKELASQGFDEGYIATWIGEKNVQSLAYYLNSRYYM